ncbi:MAG: AIR synthase family protein [Anaerovorax sp.]
MLKVGKLDSKLLEDIVFKNIKFKRPEVITRPGIGEDCAVVDFGDYDCILSTDPITAAVNEIGSLSIHISCNDIASNGVEPLGIMLAVMLPVGTTAQEIEEMMKQAGQAAEKLGVEIIGGHTEITPAVIKPVIVSTAIGRGHKLAREKMKVMKPGDSIYITKWAGLEGTGIISCDKQEEVATFLTEAEREEARAMLSQVSVVEEGVLAGKIGTSGMHDITEGGVLGAVWELCDISQTGAQIFVDQIPVKETTLKICKHFGIDYLRLISSGCMMIIVSPDKEENMEQAMEEAQIKFSCIGRVKGKEEGLYMMVNGKRKEIDPPASDELYKAL